MRNCQPSPSLSGNTSHRLRSQCAAASRSLPGALPGKSLSQRTSTLSITCILLFALLPALAQAEPTNVVVAALEQLGPEDPAYSKLPSLLIRAINSFPDTTSAELKSACSVQDESCQLEAARKQGAHSLLRGSVERFVDGYALRLSLVDVKSAKRRNSSQVVKGGAPALRSAAEKLSCELIVKKGCEGQLQVEGPTGTKLWLNGKDLGTLPVERQLPMGRHVLWAQQDERSSPERVISVAYQQKLHLQVEEKRGRLELKEKESKPALTASSASGGSGAPLAPSSAPSRENSEAEELADSSPDQGDEAESERKSELSSRSKSSDTSLSSPPGGAAARRVFWGGVIAGGTLMATGTGFGIAAQVGASDLNRRYHRNELSPSDASSYDAVRAQATVANLSFGLASLALVTSAATWLLFPEAVFPKKVAQDAAVAQAHLGAGFSQMARQREREQGSSAQKARPQVLQNSRSAAPGSSAIPRVEAQSAARPHHSPWNPKGPAVTGVTLVSDSLHSAVVVTGIF